VVVEPFELAPVGWTGRVETHAHHVDGNVVVVPTKGDQIVRIVVATTGSWSDVMGL
jgi:hypothetical protein